MADVALELAVLRAVAARDPEAGYERPTIDGYSAADIDVVVDELRRLGLMRAAEVSQTFGDHPRYWAPSVITDKGRQRLAELAAPQPGSDEGGEA